MTDPEMVDMSKRMNIPQLLKLSAAIEGAQELYISDAAGLLGWIQDADWSARLEEDLQCISQDQEGRPILSTWISMDEFEKLATDAEGTKHGAQIQKALEVWKAIGPAEITFEGHRYVSATASALSQ
jgi:hypothetical protein